MKLVERFDLYNYSKQKGYVELYDISESCIDEDSVVKYLAKIASLSYGNEDSKNPNKLVEKLIKLGHTSVLEFVRIPYIEDDISCKVVNYNVLFSMRNNKNIKSINKSIKILKTLLGDVDEEELLKSFKEAVKMSLALFKIKVPVFVARQLMRHRGFSYLEMSRRYVKNTKKEFEFWNNEHATKDIFDFYDKSVELYNNMIKNKERAEVARSVLPLSMYTELYVLGDKDSLFNFFIERCNVKAQPEIREVAIKMITLLEKHQLEFQGLYVKYKGNNVDGVNDKSNTILSITNIPVFIDLFIKNKKVEEVYFSKAYKGEYFYDKDLISKVKQEEIGDDYYAVFSVKDSLFKGKVLKNTLKLDK